MRRLAVLAPVLLAVTSYAQPKPTAPTAPVDRIVFSNLLVARANPIGLEDQIRAGYQRRLYASDSAALKDNFLFLGAHPKLNPAGIKIGPSLELQPMSMLNLRASWDFVAWFGLFNCVQSFRGPEFNYSDATLRTLGAYATTGSRLTLDATLQAKVGPIVIRNRLGFERWSANLREGDRVFYEATHDTLLPNDGWTMSDDLDVLWMGGGPVIAGLRYSGVLPFYRPRHHDSPLSETAENAHSRLGLLALYLLPDGGSPQFSRPAIVANVAWYLGHRYRAGTDNRFVPYLILGFSFQSDLLPRS